MIDAILIVGVSFCAAMLAVLIGGVTWCMILREKHDHRVELDHMHDRRCERQRAQLREIASLREQLEERMAEDEDEDAPVRISCPPYPAVFPVTGPDAHGKQFYGLDPEGRPYHFNVYNCNLSDADRIHAETQHSLARCKATNRELVEKLNSRGSPRA